MSMGREPGPATHVRAGVPADGEALLRLRDGHHPDGGRGARDALLPEVPAKGADQEGDPVIADPKAVLGILGLPADTPFEVEPLGDLPGSPERWQIAAPGRKTTVIVRCPLDPEEGANQAAMMEALTKVRFAHMPGLLGVAGPGDGRKRNQGDGDRAASGTHRRGLQRPLMEGLAGVSTRCPCGRGSTGGARRATSYPPG